MNAVSQIKPETDSILIFMPQISEAEYEQRKRLRAALDVALSALSQAPDGVERDLWVTLRNHAQDWIMKPAPVEAITAASDVCTAIWRAVQRAVALNEGIDLRAAPDGRR